jgi:hypothetical protein
LYFDSTDESEKSLLEDEKESIFSPDEQLLLEDVLGQVFPEDNTLRKNSSFTDLFTPVLALAPASPTKSSSSFGMFAPDVDTASDSNSDS